MKFFLKRLQEDQQDMLELIQQREKARKTGLDEPQLPSLKVPAAAVDWDLPYTPPHRLQPAAVDAFVQVCLPACKPTCRGLPTLTYSHLACQRWSAPPAQPGRCTN